MSELREPLNLPNLGGEIVARVYPGASWARTPRGKLDRFFWEIEITVKGPNARYNPGQIKVESSNLQKLIEIINKALETMRAIAATSFAGTFTKEIGEFKNMSVEVRSSSGKSSAYIWVHNNTRWKFSRILDETDLFKAIEILQLAELRANNLVESLKIIHTAGLGSH